MEEHVREDIQPFHQMAVQRMDIEAGAFLCGEGVELSADGVHPCGKLGGGAVLAALEEHMLNKMGSAGLLRCLGTESMGSVRIRTPLGSVSV